MHALFEYNVNVTGPVGATSDVFWNVAASPTVTAVPTVIEVGSATVVIVGDAFPTAITSLAPPHPVVYTLLFASPG